MCGLASLDSNYIFLFEFINLGIHLSCLYNYTSNIESRSNFTDHTPALA